MYKVLHTTQKGVQSIKRERGKYEKMRTHLFNQILWTGLLINNQN